MSLRAENLVKHYAGIYAVEDFSLTLTTGVIHALIGPNGAGKSTAIGLLTGEVRTDAGRIFYRDAEITHQPTWRRARSGIGHTYQITSVVREMSVLDNMRIAMLARQDKGSIGLGSTRRNSALNTHAKDMLEKFELLHTAQQLAGQLSHGEQGRLEIAICLATRPSVLLLDEPMSGMSLIDGERMISLLSGIKQTTAILLVEHDMDAVFKLADRISVMASGQIIASGEPEEIRNNAAVIKAYLGES